MNTIKARMSTTEGRIQMRNGRSGGIVNRSMRRVEGNHKHNLSNGVLKSRGSDSPLAYALRVHINAVHASVFVMLVASLISRRAGTSPLALMYLSKVTMLKTPPALRKIQ